jgi:hypothetical protein
LTNLHISIERESPRELCMPKGLEPTDTFK